MSKPIFEAWCFPRQSFQIVKVNGVEIKCMSRSIIAMLEVVLRVRSIDPIPE